MECDFYVIDKVVDGERYVEAHNKRDGITKGQFYLQPLNRTSCSKLAVGDEFFGILNTSVGWGCVLCITEGHDFGGFFNYDLKIDGGLVVSNDVRAEGDLVGGDCKVGSGVLISLGTHIHATPVGPSDGPKSPPEPDVDV